MNTRIASLALALGVVVGSAFGLYDAVPAAALAGWALAAVALTGLQKAEESFFVARNGAVFCVVAEVAALASIAEGTTPWVRYVGLLTLLAGAAAAYRKVLPETFRDAAAGRLGTAAYATVIPLALAAGLVEAGSGPAWTGTVVDILRAAVLVLVAWFAAFAACARDAVRVD